MLKQERAVGGEGKGWEGNTRPEIAFIKVGMFKPAPIATWGWHSYGSMLPDLLAHLCSYRFKCCQLSHILLLNKQQNLFFESLIVQHLSVVQLPKCTTTPPKWRQLPPELYPRHSHQCCWVEEGERGLASPSPLSPAPLIVCSCFVCAEIKIRRSKMN